jgi:mRNA interferase YafQ
MRTIERSAAFKKDYKRLKASPHHRRDANELVSKLLTLLVTDEALPESSRDHALIGQWQGYRECHIKPDLLLIYRKQDADVLRLARLGSHSDLFG